MLLLDFTIAGLLRQAVGGGRFAGACFACLALAVGGVLATPAEPILLPPWIVEEPLARSQPTVREDAFASLLGAAAVVPAGAWSGQAVATLAETLRGVPGLLVQESFGGFEPPRISMRGSGLDSAPTARGVALLADGLPLARADGSFHSGLLDPLLFARLEVYRGSLHTALTPAVLGGVLHAVSFSRPDADRAAVRGEGGDFGRFRGQFLWATPSTTLAASVAEARGWRDHSRQDRRALLSGTRVPLGGSAGLELSAYRGHWRDEILRLADASGLPRGAVNAGTTSHRGIETGLRWRPSERWPGLTLAATSTLGRFTFADDPVYGRNRIAGAPPHVGMATLAYDPPRGWLGAVETTWVAGRTSVDHAGRLAYGGQALFHARAGWQWRDGWKIFLAVRNLLDRHHLASTAGVLDLARAPAATAIFLPGTGRALSAGCEWSR